MLVHNMPDEIEQQAIQLAQSKQCRERFDELFEEGHRQKMDYVTHLEFVTEVLTTEFIDDRDDHNIDPSGEKLFKAIFKRQVSKRFQRNRSFGKTR